MSYYVIGIGGTGARCMEAFIYLNGAGLLKDRGDVTVIYVDADVSCGNLLRTQKAAVLYNKAHGLVDGTRGLIKNKLLIREPWTPVPSDNDCKSMDDILDYKLLKNNDEESYVALKMLYEALFTKKERETSLKEGFRGHPAIGAAVMSKSLFIDDGADWADIKDRIDNDPDPRVFLFASAFGGTGAAGFPTIERILVKQLRKREKNEKDKKEQILAKIGGCLLLPYFNFPLANAEQEKELQAKADDFVLNTRAALDYYNSSSDLLNDVFKAIYLVGEREPVKADNFSLGSKTQENDANIVELYAALAAFDFFNKDADFFNKGKEDGASTKRCPTYMISREDSIEWKDLPSPSVDGPLKDKMSAYIKFLYVYRNVILPQIRDCGKDAAKRNEVAWYRNLVEKAGRIDVYHDQQKLAEFEALGEYAAEFFKWLGQIIKKNDNGKTQKSNALSIDLVDEGVVAEVNNPKANLLAVDQLILSKQEGKGKLDYEILWRRLCNYRVTSTNSSGAKILVQAVYDVCNK